MEGRASVDDLDIELDPPGTIRDGPEPAGGGRLVGGEWPAIEWSTVIGTRSSDGMSSGMSDRLAPIGTRGHLTRGDIAPSRMSLTVTRSPGNVVTMTTATTTNPAVLDLVPDAARIFGIGRAAAYASADRGELVPGVPILARKASVASSCPQLGAIERVLGIDIADYLTTSTPASWTWGPPRPPTSPARGRVYPTLVMVAGRH